MLFTKIKIPDSREQLVLRLELFSKLTDGLKHKLILISAPAGFGKTTLMSEWAHQQKSAIAWFSINVDDNDPVIFLNYVINAISCVFQGFGNKPLELLNSGDQSSIKTILNLVINELTLIKENVLLVLDDYHLIENNEINDSIIHMLVNLPENVHISILTRSDPVLPLARLRSQQQLTEIRAEDLSFTKNEIAGLFNNILKLPISESLIDKLLKKTEGWIAGLQLASISMQNQDDISGFIDSFSGSNRYIMEYLIDEVLKNLSPDIKKFLIYTSLLEQFSASLCNAILDRNDSQAVLEKLETDNMFLFPQDNSRQNYRYHHLFADLLQQKLYDEETKVIDELHNRTADWYAENGFPFLSIKHALKAKNYIKSVKLFARNIANMWKNGQHRAIINIGETIPRDYLLKETEVCLYYSWILMNSGNISEAAVYLDNAEKICRQKMNNTNISQTDLSTQKQMLGKVAVVYAYYFVHIPKPDKIEAYSTLAINNLSKEETYWLSWAWFSSANFHTMSNDVIKAMQCFQKALAYAMKSNSLYLVSFITISLGYLEFRLGQLHSSYTRCKELLFYIKERGYLQYSKEDSTYALLYAYFAAIECYWMDLGSAKQNIDIAYDSSKDDSNITNKAIILVNRSLINYVKESKDTSWAMIGELENLRRSNDFRPEVLTLYISWKGFMLVDQGRLNEAELFFIEYQLNQQSDIDASEIHRYTPLALWLILVLRFERAENLLLKLFEKANTQQRIEHKVEIKILMSILYLQSSNIDRALESIIESMEYASKENILVYYILFLKRIKVLFDEAFKYIATRKTSVSKDFIQRLKSAISKHEQIKTAKNAVELSNRELDVLKLIDAHYTNQQIAEKLFISLHTVKSHVKNILFKLEVDRRSKAAGKARETGII